MENGCPSWIDYIHSLLPIETGLFGKSHVGWRFLSVSGSLKSANGGSGPEVAINRKSAGIECAGGGSQPLTAALEADASGGGEQAAHQAEDQSYDRLDPSLIQKHDNGGHRERHPQQVS